LQYHGGGLSPRLTKLTLLLVIIWSAFVCSILPVSFPCLVVDLEYYFCAIVDLFSNFIIQNLERFWSLVKKKIYSI
jgi:hypothetical protein